MTLALVTEPGSPGWAQIEPEAGYLRCWTRAVAPFGRLSVQQPAMAPETWHVCWRPSNASAVFQVTGPHPDREAAQAAALRWLFDAWAVIEAQLGGEAPAEKVLTVSQAKFTALALAALLVAAFWGWALHRVSG